MSRFVIAIFICGFISTVVNSVLAYSRGNNDATWGWAVAAIWCLASFITGLDKE